MPTHRSLPLPPAWTALLLAISSLATPLAHAQEASMPSDLPRTTSASLTATTSDAHEGDVDEAGALGWELLAGTGAVAAAATLSVGIGLAVAHDCAPDSELTYDCSMTGAGTMVLTYLAAAPLLSSLAVTLTGDATDGQGKYLSTLGASLIGGFAGLGLASGIAVAGRNSDGNPLITTLVFGALLSGPLVGALVGYRMSAQPRVHAYAMPTLDGRGAIFSLGGAL